MSAEDFLRSTPPEINWKIEAWNKSRERKASDDYAMVSLVRLAVASLLNEKNKFPSFAQFYPDSTKKIKQVARKYVSKAMDVAKALGHI